MLTSVQCRGLSMLAIQVFDKYRYSAANNMYYPVFELFI